MLASLLRFIGQAILSLYLLTSFAIESNDFSGKAGLEYRSAWSCENDSKFYWYCEKPAEIDDENESQSKPKKPKATKTQEEMAQEELEAFKKELEGKRALAVMRPTPENVKQYIEAQERLGERASLVSDVWRRVVWQNPEINYQLKRPVTTAGLETYKSQRTGVEKKTIESIRKDWGIFFFFKSDCPYCHKMGPIIKFISEEYGITVFPISVDGQGIPDYPKPAPDNGMTAKLKIRQVPTLVLGNIKDKRLVMLGSGVVSGQDLIERIYILTSTRPGELY